MQKWGGYLSNTHKGFTLIELLAVIVILAVIALIATPIILNMIESAKKSAAKDSAYGYIKAIEYETSLADLKGKKYEDKEDYTYNEIKVNIKGEAPTGGRYSLKNGVVTSGVFCINGYTVNYSDNTMTVGDKGCTGEDLKYEGKVVLSETKGDYTYPESGTFEVKENLSGGDLSCTTSDAEVATCSIEGNVVTVTPGTKEDSATITIISASTEKYKESQAAYLVKTAKGLLTINAYDYTGTYDGKKHSIILEVEDATIKYGTEEGKYTLTENPKYVDADTYTVYYQIEKEGYNTIMGSKKVTINKANNTLTLSAKSATYTYPESGTFTVTKNTSGGSLSCTTSNSSVATCSIEGNVVTVTPVTTEEIATITVTSASTTNYNEGQAAHVATTAKGTIPSITASGYNGKYDGEAHGITVSTTLSGAIIKYGTSEGKYDKIESPTYSDAGSYTVYYEITKEGYTTVIGRKYVVINKAVGNATLSSTSGTTYVGYSTTFTVSNATGSLSCTSSNTSVATCSIEGNTVTLKGISDGSAIITLSVESTINYTSISKSYSLKVKQPTALSTNVKLGDYIKMIPTSTSFTTDTSKTGYNSSQIIDPSELNLWRVIKINNDGTIEMISEYVSSTRISFQGKIGYKNLVGYLNVIANQYQNTKYTIKSRYVGYNGQTEYLESSANPVTETGETPPWTVNTGNGTVESQGGGDVLYTKDTDLIETVLGTLVAKNPHWGSSSYWLASRYYDYYDSNNQWNYSGRFIENSGIIKHSLLMASIKGGGYTTWPTNSLRPIVTIKSGLIATGSGTSSDPYVLP